MRFDAENNRILVRQSWIGDALMCPQRAKYALTYQSLRTGSDATAIGTGVHATIEQYLRGDVAEPESFVRNTKAFVEKELSKGVKRTAISRDEDKMWRCVESMATAWWDDIRPVVPLGGKAEYNFKSPLGLTASNGMEIWLEGTIDYVAPDGVLWDWKTASRTYSLREKHTQSHQATCYVTACRQLGLVPDTDEPTLFRFGVMVRQESPKAQIVTVARDRDQVGFLKRQIKSVVDGAVAVWGNEDWMMNDQHFLCSETWCDYWTMCKGAHWTADACESPDQTVTPVTVTITEPSGDRDVTVSEATQGTNNLIGESE
jgi:hypothetical protein